MKKARTLADKLGDNRLVYAPCCGRHTNADMILLTDKLKAEKKQNYERYGIRLHKNLICDGCRERLMRVSGIGRADFYRDLQG